MRKTKRLFSALALTCGLLVAAGTTGAVAQAAVQPSLEGEVFLAGADAGVPAGTSMYEVTLRCGANPPSQWNYTASGVASGPYPGTFTETGEVTIDADGLGGTGPVLTLTANFAIQSGTTVISGTKTLKLDPENTGSCLSGSDRYDAKFKAIANYTATIDTPTGSYTDDGTVNLDTHRSERFDLSNGGVSLGGTSRFKAEFDSNGGTDPAPIGKSYAAGFGLMGSLRSPIVFGFFAKKVNTTLKGLCAVFDPSKKTVVACTSVDSYVAVDGKAIVTGEAYVNKVKTRYRIEASDGGRSWFGDSFKITTDSGYSASSAGLMLGAIQIKS